MKCFLCEKYFVTNLTFSSIFRKYQVCLDCQRRFTPLNLRSTLPGYRYDIDVITFFDECNINDILESKVLLWMKPFLPMNGFPEIDFLLWADQEVIETKAIWMPLLSAMGKVLVISIFQWQWETNPLWNYK